MRKSKWSLVLWFESGDADFVLLRYHVERYLREVSEDL